MKFALIGLDGAPIIARVLSRTPGSTRLCPRPLDEKPLLTRCPPTFKATLACLLAATALALHAQNEPSDAGLVLPGITSHWRLPGDEALPTITIDEAQACVGENQSIRQRVGELRQQEAALIDLRTAMEQQANGLKRETAAITAALTEQDGVIRSLNERAARIVERRAELERLRQKPATTPAAVKAFNSQVDAFNATLNEHRRQSDAARRAAAGLLPRIEAQNAQATALNARIASFEAQRAAYKTAVARYTEDMGTHNAGCAGNRTLQKPQS